MYHVTILLRSADILQGLWGAEAGFLAIVVIYGLVEIYAAWNLPSQTNQSKWILFSLYNCILTGGVCLPIISLVDNERDTSTVVFLIFKAKD